MLTYCSANQFINGIFLSLSENEHSLYSSYIRVEGYIGNRQFIPLSNVKPLQLSNYGLHPKLLVHCAMRYLWASPFRCQKMRKGRTKYVSCAHACLSAL